MNNLRIGPLASLFAEATATGLIARARRAIWRTGTALVKCRFGGGGGAHVFRSQGGSLRIHRERCKLRSAKLSIVCLSLPRSDQCSTSVPAERTCVELLRLGDLCLVGPNGDVSKWEGHTNGGFVYGFPSNEGDKGACAGFDVLIKPKANSTP